MTTAPDTTAMLPPLPEPLKEVAVAGYHDGTLRPALEEYFDADQMHAYARAAIAALAGQADAVAVAWCDPTDPRNEAAFAWPGTSRTTRHTMPLYTTPPAAIPVDALRELANEWRDRANDLRHAGLSMADPSPAIREAEKIDAFADELAALIAATKEAGAVPDDIAQSMKFYGVDSLVELARIQSQHVERLQTKLPPSTDNHPRNPRGA